MSSLNGRPSRKAIEAMRGALGQASLKQTEKEAIMRLWVDFKIHVKRNVADFRDIEAICDAFIVRAEAEIMNIEYRSMVVGRFEELRKRAKEVCDRPDEFLGNENEE